jgi:UDP:flavonoid glycosyltransferase YjiC (YdhE family)
MKVTAVSWELHRPTFDAVGVRFVAAGPKTSGSDIRATAQRSAATRSPMEQVAILRDFHLRQAGVHYRQLLEAFAGKDLVLLHGIHSLAEAAARDEGIPWASAVFDPILLPTRTAPPPGMPNLGPLNSLEWRLLDRMLRRLDGPLTGALRAAGSRSAGTVTVFRARSTALHLVACSPHLMQVPPDLPAHVRVTGAWAFDAAAEPLGDQLAAFLDAGPPPVVVSFGSMDAGEAVELGAVVADGIRGSSMRSSRAEKVGALAVSSGWADRHLR